MSENSKYVRCVECGSVEKITDCGQCGHVHGGSVDCEDIEHLSESDHTPESLAAKKARRGAGTCHNCGSERLATSDTYGRGPTVDTPEPTDGGNNYRRECPDCGESVNYENTPRDRPYCPDCGLILTDSNREKFEENTEKEVKA